MSGRSLSVGTASAPPSTPSASSYCATAASHAWALNCSLPLFCARAQVRGVATRTTRASGLRPAQSTRLGHRCSLHVCQHGAPELRQRHGHWKRAVSVARERRAQKI